MKRFAPFGVFLSLLIAFSVAEANIIPILNCETKDGLFIITIVNNQASGLVPSAHLIANVKNRQGDDLATYEVYLPQLGSASFGRSYVDKATDGQNFSFHPGGATNIESPVLIRAVLKDGSVLHPQKIYCH